MLDWWLLSSGESACHCRVVWFSSDGFIPRLKPWVFSCISYKCLAANTTIPMLTCPQCGYLHGSTDERGRPAGAYDDSVAVEPAQTADGSFFCPRCDEAVTPE